MRKIFISAGHTRKGQDAGAAANGYKEGDLTAELRDLICQELIKNHNVRAIVDDDKNALQQTINYFRALVNPKAILLDIHFNAASPQASGTECFIPNDFSNFEKNLAKDLAEDCSDVLKIKQRIGTLNIPGVKLEKESARGSLGWFRLTGENVLLEVCFITNKNEIEQYQKKKHELAKAIAYSLFRHCILP